MSLGNALGYLTVLPVPYKKHIPLIRSIHFFPLVGAGMGSLGVLLFLGARSALPEVVSCILAIAALQALNGGTQLRGVAELAQGRQTFPGHGFDAGFKLNRRGYAAVAALLLIKSAALALLPSEWQPRAVLLLPILGRCAQTLAFILSPHRLPDPFARDATIVRRRVRAAFLSAALLFLLFLFPWRAALPALGLFALIAVGGLRLCNARFRGLTLQTVSFLSESAEAAVLVWLAVAVQGLLP
jgi:adenosylcobinamide-GDP ribazoletransferase